MTRIAICADLHVDDFGNRIDPRTGWNARFEDAIAAVEFIAEAAVEAKADALVVAGDYTERRSPAPPRVARIVDALRLGPRRQIHVRGNHDQERSGRSIVDVLGQIDGWDGFTQPGISLVDDVAICAVPFLSPTYLRAQPGMESAPAADVYKLLGEAYLTVARGLFAQAQALGSSTSILVGHQQLAGGRMNDSQAAFLGDLDLVVDARALAAIGYGAVIFGHVHKAQTVIDDPACPVMFVGSSHRVDFAEEHDDQRFLLVDVVDGRVAIESVRIPARRFLTVDASEIRMGATEWAIEGAIVRVINVPAEESVIDWRRTLEDAGAFEVQEIRNRSISRPESAGGMAEGLTAAEALLEYFVADPSIDDHEAAVLVERGRGILLEVAS